jgi:hypothetical protein
MPSSFFLSMNRESKDDQLKYALYEWIYVSGVVLQFPTRHFMRSPLMTLTPAARY